MVVFCRDKWQYRHPRKPDNLSQNAGQTRMVYATEEPQSKPDSHLDLSYPRNQTTHPSLGKVLPIALIYFSTESLRDMPYFCSCYPGLH